MTYYLFSPCWNNAFLMPHERLTRWPAPPTPPGAWKVRQPTPGLRGEASGRLARTPGQGHIMVLLIWSAWQLSPTTRVNVALCWGSGQAGDFLFELFKPHPAAEHVPWSSVAVIAARIDARSV